MQLEDLRPLRGKVLIERVGDPEKIGSLFVPDTVKERAQKGIVRALAPDVDDLDCGDAIIFQPWSDSWLFRVGFFGTFFAVITPKIIEAKLFLEDEEPRLIPFRDRCLIQPDTPDSETRSGLYIHRTEEERIFGTRGRVLAAGPLCRSVAQGDDVFFGPYVGTTIGATGIERIIVRERDIEAIVRTEDGDEDDTNSRNQG